MELDLTERQVVSSKHRMRSIFLAWVHIRTPYCGSKSLSLLHLFIARFVDSLIESPVSVVKVPDVSKGEMMSGLQITIISIKQPSANHATKFFGVHFSKHEHDHDLCNSCDGHGHAVM